MVFGDEIVDDEGHLQQHAALSETEKIGADKREGFVEYSENDIEA